MPTTTDRVRERITAGIAGAEVEVEDLTGAGDHFRARVVAQAFEGRSPVERHQMVYAAVREEMDCGAIHALALATYTPAQWGKSQGADA